MDRTHRTLTLWPLLGLACLPLSALATESNDKAGVAAATARQGLVVAGVSDAMQVSSKKAPLDETLLPLCTPGLSKGSADEGALGLYDIGGGKFAADLADPSTAADCVKATSGNLSLRVEDINLNLGGSVQYLGLTGSPQRTIRAGTINPALCESYLTGASTYTLELRNSNNDIQGPSGLLHGISSLSYQLGTGAVVPELMRAMHGPWLRCFDATLANVALPPVSADSIFDAGFESSADLRVEYLDAAGAPITSGEMTSTIGSNSVYKVRVSNRGEGAASGVRIREFLPKAAGPLTPTMDAISCVNDTTSQNCNVDPSGALLQNIASLASGDSVTYTMTRRVNGASPVSAAVGALTAVAAFVDPNAVAEADPRTNSRHLRIGLVTNGAPVANAVSRTTPEDTAVGVTLSGSDPDGDALVAWTIATQPAHGDVTGSGVNLTYTPDPDYAGVDSFTYRVTDDEGGVSIPATVTITVTPVNDGPRIATQMGNVTLAEGSEVAISTLGAFSDPEGNAFTVSVGGLPSGVSYFSAVNAITGNLSLSSAGTYTVTLTATETGTGLTASQQFTLTVTNSNQAPTLNTALGDRTNSEGDVVSISVAGNFSDADPGDVLSFSLFSGSLPPGLSLASNGQITGAISQTAAAGSPYNAIRIRASDGQGGRVDALFNWTVNAVNAAPQAIGSIPNQTDTVNTSFFLSGSNISSRFTDPDGQTLTYSISGQPPGIDIDEVEGAIFGTSTATGVFNVTVTASDGALTATQSFTFTINPAPQ